MPALHPPATSVATLARSGAVDVVAADTLIVAIRSVLSDDLLKPAYRKQSNRKPTTGHCYAASEALYHLLGGRDAGLVPMVLRHEGGPHWFLRTAEGTFLDPTGDQFTTPPMHSAGKGCGFLTRQPSQRAQEILRRLTAIGNTTGNTTGNTAGRTAGHSVT